MFNRDKKIGIKLTGLSVIQRQKMYVLICGWLVTLCMILHSRESYGLDPNRSLTQYLHRIWQTQQGLPPSTIFSIEQTSDGYIWLATQTGLFRFDGLRFNEVRSIGNVSLEKRWFIQVIEDKNHALWAATKSDGLYKIDSGTAMHFTQAEGLPSNSLSCLCIDKKDRVWIGSDRGLVKIVNGKIEPFGNLQQQFVQGNILAVTEASDGAIWFAADANRIINWNGSEFKEHTLKNLKNGSQLNAILGGRDGSLWIGISAGLIRLENENERLFTHLDGLADDHVLCLSESFDGAIWIGTKGGVSRKQPDKSEGFSNRDDLSQNTVYSICEDREGCMWIGTKHGLNQFVDRRIIPFTTNEGLPSNDAGPVTQDESGAVWVGTLDGGLGRYDGQRFSVITPREGLASERVLALSNAENNSLWVGTSNGLNLIAKDRVIATYVAVEGLPSSSIQCLFQDRDQKLWVGTTAGLTSFKEGQFTAVGEDQGLPATSILAITQPLNKGIVVATHDRGVFIESDGKFQQLKIGDLTTTPADAFYQDAEGLIWIGTRGGGLKLYDGEHLYSFSIKEGLYDDDIYGITADDEDRLWMACSKGIFSVRKTDLRHLAAGDKATLTCEPFSPTEAQRTIECRPGIQPAVWKMADGKIWFTTMRGMIVIDPHRLQRKLPPIPVTIEETIINGKIESTRESLNLSSEQSSLMFRYAALSFLSPARVTYRYKLDGFDHDWIDAGSRREAFYTNLPPGDYRFRVVATNVDGASNEAVNPISFHIDPHFYQTNLFYGLAAVVICGTIWFFYQLRVRNMQEQLNAIASERGRIARELHDTLMQGFSGVTMEMQALTTRLSLPSERDALQEIISDATNCLRDARHTVAGLRHSAGSDVDFSTKLAENARQIIDDNNIQLQLKLHSNIQGLSSDVEYHLLRIAQEAIVNVVKHSKASMIIVTLEHNRKHLLLSIQDNGIGFDMQSNNKQQERFGLIGMRERAKQMGAEFHLESKVGTGTTVKVVVPMQSAHHHSPGSLKRMP